MASRKASGRSVAMSQKPVASSKLPSWLQFLLVVILSFSTSFVSFSAASIFTNFELSTVSRSVNETWEVLAFPLWRIVELAVGWYLGYDDYDMASLTLQTRLPYYHLLTSFYGITASTSIICLGLDVLSATVPFYLLRRRLPAHSPAPGINNQSVVVDWTIFALTSALGASIYALVVYGSSMTWLPVHLVSHFDGLRSVEKAHNAQIPILLLTFLPIGWAARTFLFSPSTTAVRSLSEIKATAFNPETASLGSTIKHNVWGYSKGTKVTIKRTAILAALVGLTTWIRVWKTIEGSEGVGAAGWAGMWVLASSINGAVMRWVGDV